MKNLSQLETVDSANCKTMFDEDSKRFVRQYLTRIVTILVALLFGLFSGLGGNMIFNQPLSEVKVSEEITLPTYPKKIKPRCVETRPLIIKHLNKITLKERKKLLELYKKLFLNNQAKQIVGCRMGAFQLRQTLKE